MDYVSNSKDLLLCNCEHLVNIIMFTLILFLCLLDLPIAMYKLRLVLVSYLYS